MGEIKEKVAELAADIDYTIDEDRAEDIYYVIHRQKDADSADDAAKSRLITEAQ